MTSKTIADAARKALASFDAIDQISVDLVPDQLDNEDSRSRYKIWASNLGSIHPAIDRRSADYRLREAPEVTDRVVELLEELSETNSEILEILTGTRTNRQVLESEDDSGPDELSELHLSIGDILTSLFKVSMLVKKATQRDRYAKAASAKDDIFLAEFDIRHVADKYPKTRARPWLLERLGKAITQRRQFLRYCRNHKNRIAHVASPSIAVAGHPSKPSDTDGKLEVPMHTENAASSTHTPLTRPTLSPTTASTLYPDKIVREDLQNLDNEDDAVSQVTSVAYSQIDSKDSGLLNVSRLEDLSKGGQPFECPFCFSIVQAKRQRSWRKHVLSDLRAYVCISEGCDAGMFEDKATWQEHDAQCHQRQWRCHHCRVEPFGSASSLQGHLRSMHDVGELPTGVLSTMTDASTVTVAEVAPDCPFCDFGDQIRAEATNRGQALSSSAQVVIPLVDYHRHLAFHQEQLALFAIPPAIERSVESESSHGRSRADPDEHVQFMARWQNRLTDTEDVQEEVRDVTGKPANTTISEMLTSSDGSPLIVPIDRAEPQNTEAEDTSMYIPEEGEFPSILPGDIVWIPRQTAKRLPYKKGVYLGQTRNKTHTAREWNSKSEVEVFMSTLLRKTHCTDEEKLEAKLLRDYQAIGDEDTQSQPRHRRKDFKIPAQACQYLLLKTLRLAGSSVKVKGIGESYIQPVSLNFYHRFSGTKFADGVKLEEIVRMLYATAISELRNGVTNVERSVRFLLMILIETVEEYPEIDNGALAQLRAEQDQVVLRITEAMSKGSELILKHDTGDLQGAVNGAGGSSLRIDPQTLEALKLRVQDVATGKEELSGFESEEVKNTYALFLEVLNASPATKLTWLATLLRHFETCALSRFHKDHLFVHHEQAMVLKQETLFLSLLISVGARMQVERDGSAPRIRSGFTSILMEARARLLDSASELQRESTQHHTWPEAGTSTDRPLDWSPSTSSKRSSRHADIPNISTDEFDVDSSTASHMEKSAMERPPRVMKCYQCQHNWTSTIASDLRDCPECGSYSVFADSPRRTASPSDAESSRRPKAPGEEAMGQYFSERTDKYMSLYRGLAEAKQPHSGSRDDSHEHEPPTT